MDNQSVTYNETLNNFLKNNAHLMFTIKKNKEEFEFYKPKPENILFSVKTEKTENNKTLITIAKNNNNIIYNYECEMNEDSIITSKKSSPYTIFLEDFKREFEKFPKKYENDKSVVWIMTGQKKPKSRYIGIQVGRSESLIHMLDGDIIPDAEAIIGIKTSRNKDRYDKYNDLFAEKDGYTSLKFYFVDIDKYFKPDEYEEIRKAYPNVIPEGPSPYQKAEWAEGKIGAWFKNLYRDACIYNSSRQGIEKYTYNHYDKGVENNDKTVSRQNPPEVS